MVRRGFWSSGFILWEGGVSSILSGVEKRRVCGDAQISWLSFCPSIRCDRISGRIALWRNSQNLPPGTPFLRQGKKDGAPSFVCCSASGVAI
jgi:hypothetical protein